MVDFLRIFAIVNAAVLGLICLYLSASRRAGLGPGSRLRFFGVVLTMVFIAAHEIGQLGHPLIWWRLPLLLAINIVFSVGILLGARNDWQARG